MFVSRVKSRSWFTPEGAAIQGKRLQARIPVVPYYFLTLTVDPANFSDSREAWQVGNSRLRHVFSKLKRYYSISEVSYFWKLEFHISGYPHWHLLLPVSIFKDYIGKGSSFLLFIEKVAKYWGLCSTNGVDVKRIDSASVIGYVSKYVCKGGQFPDWVYNEKKIRVFSSSPGFLLNVVNDGDECGDDGCEGSDEVKSNESTIGERILRDCRLVVIHDKKDIKLSKFRKTYYLSVDFFDFYLLYSRAGSLINGGQIDLDKLTRLYNMSSVGGDLLGILNIVTQFEYSKFLLNSC